MNGVARRRHFLFDLDGTLVDSVSLHGQAFREVLRDHALPDEFDYEPLKGMTTADAFRALGPFTGELLARLVGEKQAKYRAAVRSGQLRLMAGAEAILEYLRDWNKEIFLVTGGSGRSVQAALEVTGIHKYFRGVVTADDVCRGKPAPDGFLCCLRRFGLDAEEAVAVEDSLDGAHAAQAAGLSVVLVNHRCGMNGAVAAFPSLVEFRATLIRERGAGEAH